MPPKESFIYYRKLELKANEPLTINAGGRVFWCTAAQTQFEMGYDNNPEFPVEGKGVTWALPDPKERFSKLTFKSAVNQTIEFYHGNFLAFGNQVVPVIQVAKTFSRPGGPSGVSQLAAMSNIDLTDVPSGRLYRKAVIVTNLDPAVDLDIYTKDDGGNWVLAAAVFFRQALILETSDDVRIRNPSAGTVNVRILELFY